MDFNQTIKSIAELYIEIGEYGKRLGYAIFEVSIEMLIIVFSPIWIIPYLKWFYIPEENHD